MNNHAENIDFFRDLHPMNTDQQKQAPTENDIDQFKNLKEILSFSREMGSNWTENVNFIWSLVVLVIVIIL